MKLPPTVHTSTRVNVPRPLRRQELRSRTLSALQASGTYPTFTTYVLLTTEKQPFPTAKKRKNPTVSEKMAKIKALEYFRVPPRWLFVKITDVDGNVGWGEASLEGHTQAVEGCLDAYGERLMGLGVDCW